MQVSWIMNSWYQSTCRFFRHWKSFFPIFWQKLALYWIMICIIYFVLFVTNVVCLYLRFLIIHNIDITFNTEFNVTFSTESDTVFHTRFVVAFVVALMVALMVALIVPLFLALVVALVVAYVDGLGSICSYCAENLKCSNIQGWRNISKKCAFQNQKKPFSSNISSSLCTGSAVQKQLEAIDQSWSASNASLLAQTGWSRKELMIEFSQKF